MKSNELNGNTGVDVIKNALDSEDNNALAVALNSRFEEVKNSVLSLYEELKDETDEKILASRGIYRPTTEEKTFLDRLFKNDIGTNPTQGQSVVIPKTLVDRIFEDLENEDEGVTGLIDFQNTTGSVEWMVAVAEKPVATWGEICDPITQELHMGFKVYNTMTNKLSCYVPYCLALLELGYEWQERYVRTYIELGMREALSVAFISGNGSNKPFGMAYDYDFATDTGTLKTPVAITALDKANFGPIFASMSVNGMGYRRPLNDLHLFVDAETYYTYVFANNGSVNAMGQFYTILDQLGIQLKVTETGLTTGQAILGMPKRYAGQISFNSNPRGAITYSDDFLFLDDKRVYKAKTYADGMPKDNNAFVLLDLTGLNA